MKKLFGIVVALLSLCAFAFADESGLLDGSSVKVMGEFWLGQFSKYMI